ncbi:MAG TPA: membrane protein insertase YidC [Deltaproteobacteria bacterium]|nr:membrane protein insertase YidC [Deltaproteobacteria bacterium]
MKDQARLFIAIALSFVVFFAWQLIFVDKEKEKIQPPQPSQEAPVATGQYVKDKETTGVKSTQPAAPALIQKEGPPPVKSARMITVDSPLYSINISEQGAVFKSVELRQYRERVEADSPMKQLVAQELASGTITLGFSKNSLPGMNNAVFSSIYEFEKLMVADKDESLSFQWQDPNGVVIEKTFYFSPDSYFIRHVVTVKNGSDQTIEDNLTLSLINLLPVNNTRFGFEGPSALIDNGVEEVPTKEIAEKSLLTGNLKWMAIQDRYFISSIIPNTPGQASMKLFLDQNNVLRADYVQAATTIHPGTQQAFEYGLFFGPKNVKIMRSVGKDLDKAVDFGWFDFIARPFLWLMNFFYGYIPNYGVAIIILTILVKAILFPLGTKSYKSMNEMKKLQPIMAEIREKHKGDKKKMNEEIMGLYRTYKINPMGGCIPMVAQIPVFFALYRMLYQAIELRHAPFFGWINDLSAPDRLFRFGFTVPFMEPPFGIPVLTLVMGATMLLQQKMTPSPGDPNQARMMMLMPIVFTFIFINFSSGLVLYWLINNVLSISQQYYITRKLS